MDPMNSHFDLELLIKITKMSETTIKEIWNKMDKDTKDRIENMVEGYMTEIIDITMEFIDIAEYGSKENKRKKFRERLIE